MPVSVLIGNGFNRIADDQPSWEAVLKEIADEVGDPKIVELCEHKPETLIFEQLAFADGKSNKEDEIKAKLAAKLMKQKPNHLHETAIGLGFRHILTTNYDYNFEDSVAGGSSESRKRGSRETKYSLFRKHHLNGTSIWHIHGEARSPKTIMLGYEHYVGSLQNLRTYMTAERPSSNNARVSQFKIGNKAFDDERNGYSWLDVFLRDDIHVIGLSLDYTEADLWWAITYKQKLRFYKKKFELGQTIYHYMPAPQKDDSRKLDAKLEILRSLGVETRAFDPAKGYAASYAKALEQARSE
jgi:hypothetical protein